MFLEDLWKLQSSKTSKTCQSQVIAVDSGGVYGSLFMLAFLNKHFWILKKVFIKNFESTLNVENSCGYLRDLREIFFE